MGETRRDWEGRIWDLFVEPRKEIIESQKIRAQIIGFKITFISAGIAALFSPFRLPLSLPILFALINFRKCFLFYRIPLTSHCPVERATLSRARHALTFDMLKMRGRRVCSAALQGHLSKQFVIAL